MLNDDQAALWASFLTVLVCVLGIVCVQLLLK